jgi:hypothetical protein
MFKKIKLERVVVIYLAITDCLSLSREKHTFLCGAGEKRCAHLQLASLSLSLSLLLTGPMKVQLG